MASPFNRPWFNQDPWAGIPPGAGQSGLPVGSNPFNINDSGCTQTGPVFLGFGCGAMGVGGSDGSGMLAYTTAGGTNGFFGGMLNWLGGVLAGGPSRPPTNIPPAGNRPVANDPANNDPSNNEPGNDGPTGPDDPNWYPPLSGDPQPGPANDGPNGGSGPNWVYGPQPTLPDEPSGANGPGWSGNPGNNVQPGPNMPPGFALPPNWRDFLPYQPGLPMPPMGGGGGPIDSPPTPNWDPMGNGPTYFPLDPFGGMNSLSPTPPPSDISGGPIGSPIINFGPSAGPGGTSGPGAAPGQNPGPNHGPGSTPIPNPNPGSGPIFVPSPPTGPGAQQPEPNPFPDPGTGTTTSTPDPTPGAPPPGPPVGGPGSGSGSSGGSLGALDVRQVDIPQELSPQARQVMEQTRNAAVNQSTDDAKLDAIMNALNSFPASRSISTGGSLPDNFGPEPMSPPMFPSAYQASDGRIRYVIPETMMRCAVCHGSVGPGTNWQNLAGSPNQMSIAPQSQIEAIKLMNGEPNDAELSTMPDLAFKFGPRFFAGFQLAGSIAESGIGIAGILAPDLTGISKVLGFTALSHGTDGILASTSTLVTGVPQATMTAQGAAGAAKWLGFRDPYANLIGAGFDMTVGIGSTAGLAFRGASLPSTSSASIGETAVGQQSRVAQIFPEYQRFRGQGFTPAQAQYLAQPYVGQGHHFPITQEMANDWGIPNSIRDCSLNVLSPSGINRGRFYELHYMVDSSFRAATFPRSIGGVWRGRLIGLPRYEGIQRLWYATPGNLKLTGAAAVGGAAAAGGYSPSGDSNDE